MKLKVKHSRWLLVAMLFALWHPGEAFAADNQPLYENNFEKAALDKVPDEFLVLDGGFAVKEEDGNRFLELPGAPIGEGSGLLFGPTEKENVAVSARVFGTGTGRRFPAFGVGLNGQGAGGYKLQVSPGKKLLELYKGEAVIASTPHAWESGSWTILRLQIRRVKAGEWKVEGKAWKQGAAEPDSWTLSWTESAEPIPGRASIWGTPYATTPIRFDDLQMGRAAGKP